MAYALSIYIIPFVLGIVAGALLGLTKTDGVISIGGLIFALGYGWWLWHNNLMPRELMSWGLVWFMAMILVAYVAVCIGSLVSHRPPEEPLPPTDERIVGRAE